LGVARSTTRQFIERVLSIAAVEDPERFARIAGDLDGITIQITLEDDDESFYAKGIRKTISIQQSRPTGRPRVRMTVSRTVILGILRGEETPVESFFLGHIRAQGATADLYLVHKLFLAMAEIDVRSDRIQTAVEEFGGGRPKQPRAGGRSRLARA